MSTTAPEYLTSLRDGFADAVQQWVDQSTTAWDQWQQAWSPLAEAAGLGMPGAPRPAVGRRSRGGHDHHHGADHHHEHDHHDHAGCGCHDRCGCGDGCDCCVPAADVVVRARVGEVRVVPFLLHNPWRREREVALEVGPWHGCAGDDLEVRAVLEEEKVVLRPCEDRVVRLVVSTRGAKDDSSSSSRTDDDVSKAEPMAATTDAPAKLAKEAVAEAPAREAVDVVLAPRSRTADVASCATAYADVRFEGCARPQRVAVVVLPAECDAVDVGCDCGCCC